MVEPGVNIILLELTSFIALENARTLLISVVRKFKMCLNYFKLILNIDVQNII